VPPQWHTDVDYLKLVDFLGDSVPTGASVPISLVEAPLSGSTAYFPNPANTEFGDGSDPLSTTVNFIDGSGGQANGNSSHALDQARHFFGNTISVAPAANEVTIYEANDYLDSILKSGNAFGNTDAPVPQNFRVQNFSWMASFENENADREALRRFDFVIDRDNITAVVALSANNLSPMPELLSHSYNAIAVGRSDGIHAPGLTNLSSYGVGRSKPDLVAPLPETSFTASSTSSVATMLHSASFVQGTDAANSVVMKAILLTGATKDEFPGWSQFDGGSVWHPLDDTFGAGELNAFNSYVVAASGQTAGSTGVPTPVSRHGWDYQSIDSGDELLYDFVIPAGSTATELSIVLTWNAIINSPFHVGVPVLADLNLELVDSLDVTLDFDLGDGHLDGLSDSAVDNVEHLYLTDLAAGTYTLKVSSSDPSATDFGLAWRTATLLDTPSADFDEDGDVDGGDFLAWQRGYHTLINATHAQGDADGDGDVDSDDLAVFSSTYGNFTPPPALAATAVPEPSVLALLALGLLMRLGGRGCRNPASR
jgi:hypothetical protein